MLLGTAQIGAPLISTVNEMNECYLISCIAGNADSRNLVVIGNKKRLLLNSSNYICLLSFLTQVLMILDYFYYYLKNFIVLYKPQYRILSF